VLPLGLVIKVLFLGLIVHFFLSKCPFFLRFCLRNMISELESLRRSNCVAMLLLTVFKVA
jgi:hypothetical protein